MLVALCDGDPTEHEVVRSLARDVSRQESLPVRVAGAGDLAALVEGRQVPDVLVFHARGRTSGAEAVERVVRVSGYRGVLVAVLASPSPAVASMGELSIPFSSSVGSIDASFASALLEAVALAARGKRRLFQVRGLSGVIAVPVSSVSYVSVERHTCRVHYGDGRSAEFISSLDRVEEALAPYGFLRTHRAYLVNGSMVSSLARSGATLADGTRVPVGRSKYAQLKRDVIVKVPPTRSPRGV